MKNRILIMSASVGSGHVRAADALARVFRGRADVEEVFCDDALEHTNPLYKEINSSLYAVLAELAPDFLGWWYERTNDPWRSDRLLRAIELLNTRPLVEFIKDFRPTSVVCTHFTPAGVMAHLIAKEKINAQLSVVVTDFHFHAFWIVRAFHWYFVAHEEDKVHMQALGFPGERIRVTGIPIDPAFSEPVDRRAVCARFDLHPDRPTLLVSAGALGVSPASVVVKRLLELGDQVQAVVICGKNQKLKSEIEDTVAGKSGTYRVIGYTTEMAELMAVSHLLLSKPGGLTTSEALARGLPMVVLDPVGGQEERNAEFLLENGAAIACSESTLLSYKVGKLLQDRDRLKQMSENAKRLGRPYAARDIASFVLHHELPPRIITPEEEVRLRRQVAES